MSINEPVTRNLGAGRPPRALVRFAPDARVADITALLDSYQASIVDGAQGGMFRLQFGNKAMTKDEIAGLMSRLQSEKIVSLAVAAPIRRTVPPAISHRFEVLMVHDRVNWRVKTRRAALALTVALCHLRIAVVRAVQAQSMMRSPNLNIESRIPTINPTVPRINPNIAGRAVTAMARTPNLRDISGVQLRLPQ